MELHQIKSFVTVAKTGNLTRAARLLNTTPPSVSTHIKQLEDEHHVILFSRTPRGMVLTRAGKDLAEKAKAILGAAGEFSRAALALGSRITGSLTLGINGDPGFLRIESIVHDLYENHPGLTIEVVPSNTQTIMDRIAEGDLDMGYVFGSHDRPGLVFRALSRVDLAVAVPSGFGLEIREMGWEEIAGLPWIRPATLCPFLDQVNATLARKKLRLTQTVTANDDITKTALINRGVAITVLERSEAEALERAGKVFIWENGKALHTCVSLVFSSSRADQPDIRTLARTVEGCWGKEEV